MRGDARKRLPPTASERVPAPVDQAQRQLRKAQFRAASDRLLAAGVTVAEIAEAFDRSTNLVDKWRGPGARDYQPPADWSRRLAAAAALSAERGVAQAAERAALLRAIAEELGGTADDERRIEP